MATSRSGSHLAPSSKGSHSAKKNTGTRGTSAAHSRQSEDRYTQRSSSQKTERFQEDNSILGYGDYARTDDSNAYAYGDNSPRRSRSASDRREDVSTRRNSEPERDNADNVRTKRKSSKSIRNFLICVLTFCIIGGIGGVGSAVMLKKGPFDFAREVFVSLFLTTGTKQWVPRLIFSQEEIDDIMNHGSSNETEQPERYPFTPEEVVPEPSIPPVPDPDPFEMIDISGKTWRGKMLKVKDPSRVILAVPKDARSSNYSHFFNVDEYCDMYGGIASISAGGYGLNNNIPYGFVISEGELLAKGSQWGCYETVGIDYDGKLFVDWFMLDEIVERNPKYAVCWGPILVKDGVKKTGLNGGYTARCCIGQTADGTILLAVIEGRMVDSIGATADDVADLMYEYGAINAINLDSGRSCVMYYMGEQMTKISSGSGVMITDRTLPNAFVVLPVEGQSNEG